MNTFAGTLTSNEGTRTLPGSMDRPVSPSNMQHIEAYDSKGLERGRRPTGTAALRGAIVGLVVGIVIFGILFLIARANVLELRYLALYLSGIAFSSACWSSIFVLWNLGASYEG